MFLQDFQNTRKMSIYIDTTYLHFAVLLAFTNNKDFNKNRTTRKSYISLKL